jgi:hypothetical protein
MKTSDKILLCSTLSAIGLFAMVDLLHYAKYKKGEILNFTQLNALDNVPHSFTGIHHVVLDGPIRTTLYPAQTDSLTLQVPKDKQDEFLYHQNADTLIIRSKGRNAHDAHQNWFGYIDYPPLQLFFTPGTKFHILQGFATLDNEAARSDRSARFQLDSSQLWIGGYDRYKDSVYGIEPWDSISITGINSQVDLNRQAYVKLLDMRLDNRSEAVDRWSTIDSGYIQGDTNTYLHIRGKNFQKLELHVLAHP